MHIISQKDTPQSALICQRHRQRGSIHIDPSFLSPDISPLHPRRSLVNLHEIGALIFVPVSLLFANQTVPRLLGTSSAPRFFLFQAFSIIATNRRPLSCLAISLPTIIHSERPHHDPSIAHHTSTTVHSPPKQPCLPPWNPHAQSWRLRYVTVPLIRLLPLPCRLVCPCFASYRSLHLTGGSARLSFTKEKTDGFGAGLLGHNAEPPALRRRHSPGTDVSLECSSLSFNLPSPLPLFHMSPHHLS